MMIEPGDAEDEVVVVSEASRVRIDPRRSASPDLVTLNGQPLPRLRGFSLTCHVNDREGFANYARPGEAVRLRIECIHEPVRVRADKQDAVRLLLEADQQSIEVIEGMLVNEQEWCEFIAWKRRPK